MGIRALTELEVLRSVLDVYNLHAIVDVCDDDRVFYRSSAHDYCPSHYAGTAAVQELHAARFDSESHAIDRRLPWLMLLKLPGDDGA